MTIKERSKDDSAQKNIHTETTRKPFGLTEAETPTKEQRDFAKRLRHCATACFVIQMLTVLSARRRLI